MPFHEIVPDNGSGGIYRIEVTTKETVMQESELHKSTTASEITVPQHDKIIQQIQSLSCTLYELETCVHDMRGEDCSADSGSTDQGRTNLETVLKIVPSLLQGLEKRIANVTKELRLLVCGGGNA